MTNCARICGASKNRSPPVETFVSVVKRLTAIAIDSGPKRCGNTLRAARNECGRWWRRRNPKVERRKQNEIGGHGFSGTFSQGTPLFLVQQQAFIKGFLRRDTVYCKSSKERGTLGWRTQSRWDCSSRMSSVGAERPGRRDTNEEIRRPKVERRKQNEIGVWNTEMEGRHVTSLGRTRGGV